MSVLMLGYYCFMLIFAMSLVGSFEWKVHSDVKSIEKFAKVLCR